MSKGRSIKLFLADGIPGGIITAEIMNWTGHVMAAPRSKLADLIRRDEAGRTGVYFLTGSDPEGGLKPLVYIGETDNVRKRLAQHNKDDSKDFFDRVCIVTSKDQNLTKAHAKYLESRLIAIARQAGRSGLANNTEPDYTLLPEADTADMEFFIEQLRIVLPVLGMEFLRESPRATAVAAAPVPEKTAETKESPTFEITDRKHQVHAEAREIDGEFVVLQGSQARGDSDMVNTYRALRDELKNDGTLVAEGGHYIFSKDTAFRSPSAASAVIFNRNDNGRASWGIQGSKKSYAAWQEEQVAAVAPPEEDA